MVVLVGGAVFACGGGTITPPAETPPVETPPVETPPVETPPIETPPVETPPVSYSFSAEIFGEMVDIPTNERGAMLEAFEKTSPDGLTTIKFEAGTKVTDSDNVPYKQFSVKINQNPAQSADGPTIVGPTVEFLPLYANINPPMSYTFNYADFQSQIDQVANAELKMGFILSTGNWATYTDFQVDTANKVVTIDIDKFETVALLAQPPKEIVRATEGPQNGVDITIESLSDLSAGGAASLVAKTLPGARVMIWMVNPSTGTRSAYPADRYRDADADGLVSWEWTVSARTAVGEGHMELYVTTSTDPTVLGAFNSDLLDKVFPDRAAEIVKFKKGEIELLELDEHTTLRMFPVTYK